MSLDNLQLSKETLKASLLPKRTQADGSARASVDVLANEKHEQPVLPKETLDIDQAHAIAADIFDQTLTLAGITNDEVAYLLRPISVSLVRRWRRRDARERITFTQELRLPASYHVAKFKIQNERFGYGRRALVDLVEAAGVLALLA